jgi:hypothetical protein
LSKVQIFSPILEKGGISFTLRTVLPPSLPTSHIFLQIVTRKCLELLVGGEGEAEEGGELKWEVGAELKWEEGGELLW